MYQTVRGILTPTGSVELLEPLAVSRPVHVLVTVVEVDESSELGEMKAAPRNARFDALFSEASLAHDWLTDEEEQAWHHLQAAP